MRERTSTYLASVAAIFGLALLLGLLGFRSRSLTHDEVVTWFLSQHPIAWAFRADVHPPLFYLWFWPLRQICPGPEAMRPLSALMAALALLPLVPLLAPLIPRRFVLLALLLLALSPLRVQAAHLARPYSFLLLFESLSLLLAAEAWEREGKGWWLYSLVSAAGLLTHALFLLTFLGRLLLFLPGALRRRKGAVLLVAASLTALVPFLVWVAAHGLPSEAPAPAGLRGGLVGLIIALEEPSSSLVTSFWRLPEGVQRILFMLWPILSGVALVGGLEGGGRGRVCLLSWLGGGLVLAALCGSGKAVPLPIYSLPLLPGFLACLLLGADRSGRLLPPKVGLGLVLLAGTVGLGGTALYLLRGGDNLDWRKVAEGARRLAGREGAIVCRPSAAASVLRFYLKGAPVLPEEPVIMAVAGVGRQVLPWGEPYRGEGEEAERGGKFSRVVVVNWLWKAPLKPAVPRWIAVGSYEHVRREEVEGYTQRALLDLYVRRRR